MAVGARRGDILRQFLIEALTLALIGGLAGAGLGAAAAMLIAWQARLAHPNQPLGDPLSLRLRWAGRDLCSASTRRIAPPNSIQLWRCALNKLMDTRLIKMPCLVMARG